MGYTEWPKKNLDYESSSFLRLSKGYCKLAEKDSGSELWLASREFLSFFRFKSLSKNIAKKLPKSMVINHHCPPTMAP